MGLFSSIGNLFGGAKDTLFGKGSSQQQFSNANQSAINFGQGVWGAQSPYLQDLFSRAQGMSQGGYQPQYGQAQQALNAGQQGMMQMAGDQSMDPMMGAYANEIGRQFNQQILPGLRGQAQMAGGLGSSRAGIGQGLAAAQMGQQMQDFGAQLYGGQQDRRLQAQQGLLGMAQGQAGLQGQMQAAPWYGLNQYRGLLGSPVQNQLGSVATGTTNSVGTGTGAEGGLFGSLFPKGLQV